MTGRRGRPLPRLVAASAASRARGAEVPRPEHEGEPRAAPEEALRAALPIGSRQHKTTLATTVASPATGPRTARSGGVGEPTSRRPLCLAACRDDEARQWHERFGHLHFEVLKRLGAKEMVRGLLCLDQVE